MHISKDVFELIFPQGIFDWFDITDGRNEKNTAYFTFVEKDIPPLTEDQKKKKILVKKFHDITVTDFPLRGRKTVLTFRRRYWKLEGEKTYLKRDIQIMFPGTQLAKEFALFKKEEAETQAVALATIATTNRLSIKEFEKQYKDHLSDFATWEQKDHADKWLLFANNLGEKLSIDEIAVTNGELYTVVTNKKAHGGKGSLVAFVAGVKSKEVVSVLTKIPRQNRETVSEVTLDMSNAMDTTITGSFPKATIVTDRFHVQQLVTEAVQEIRIGYRKEAIKEESKAILQAREKKKSYHPPTYENGDTKKQLLARSRYLLFKPSNKWTESQQARATILFREFPKLQHAYNLSMNFRSWYETNANTEQAREGLGRWYQKIEEEQIEPFLIAAEAIKAHEETILNYFTNRSTNASANHSTRN